MFGQILGSGAGALLVALAYIAQHYLLRGGGGGGMGRPGGGGGTRARAHVWALRGTVILMFLGGILLAVTGLGNFVHTMVVDAAGYTGATVVICTILFAIALFETVHGLIKKPGRTTVLAALALAFTLTLPLAGVAGQFANQLLTSGNSYAASVSASLGF